MQLPQLTAQESALHRPVVLAVYAPFGTDETLSTYPEGKSQSVHSHPLTRHLKQVAASGTHVLALMDRAGDSTWLIDIPAGQPDAVRVSCRWKLNMADEHTLSAFVLEAHQRHPDAAMVLALEGHGAGFVPDVERHRMGWPEVTGGGAFEWHFSGQDAAPVKPDGQPALPLGYPGLPLGYPGLPLGYPGLPLGYPGLPTNHDVLSTFKLGRALALAQSQGAPRLAVVYLAGCFNASVEVLHTLAPYAEAAAGYANYYFFTAGAAYPPVFARLREAGRMSPLALARSLVQESHRRLARKPGHPIVGGALVLARMPGIAGAIDSLAGALLAAIRAAGEGTPREAVLARIQTAIEQAQQYDTDGVPTLETPDQLTDIGSLAAQLQSAFSGTSAVAHAAAALACHLDGIKCVGDAGTPWQDDAATVRWDFTAPELALNILLPDPLRSGQWDWRSALYVSEAPRTASGQPLGGVIDFLKGTRWVEFLAEYHRDVPFLSFYTGRIPPLPTALSDSAPAVDQAPACSAKRRRCARPLTPIARRMAQAARATPVLQSAREPQEA